jgi:Glycosyl transferase family 2
VSDVLAIPAQPLISVVMPVRNAAPFVADAVSSIQAQSYPRWELVVVDNESDDDSAEIVDALAARDARIRLITGVPRGIAGALNAGVDVARGQLIARMDADDVAVPGRFAVQLEWMRRTGVEVCGGWIQQFGDHEGLRWFPETHEAIARELLFRCAVMHPTVLTHAEILKRHRYDERAGFKDYELWTRLIHLYRMGNVPAVLLRYRRHANQVHFAQAAALRADLARLRAPLFDALFPDADLGDGEIVERVAEGMPFAAITDLEHAGSLLARLAQDQETLLCRRMLLRWRGACRTSAHLGSAAWRCYERGAPRFGIPAMRHDRRLRAACALRISADSRLVHGVNRLVNASRRSRHAAS